MTFFGVVSAANAGAAAIDDPAATRAVSATAPAAPSGVRVLRGIQLPFGGLECSPQEATETQHRDTHEPMTRSRPAHERYLTESLINYGFWGLRERVFTDTDANESVVPTDRASAPEPLDPSPRPCRREPVGDVRGELRVELGAVRTHPRLHLDLDVVRP